MKDESRRDNLSLVAAGIAFFALISLAPAMAAALSLYGLVADPADVARHLEELTGPMPDDARRLVEEQLTTVATTRRWGSSASDETDGLAGVRYMVLPTPDTHFRSCCGTARRRPSADQEPSWGSSNRST